MSDGSRKSVGHNEEKRVGRNGVREEEQYAPWTVLDVLAVGGVGVCLLLVVVAAWRALEVGRVLGL